jgi:hypothetical protein
MVPDKKFRQLVAIVIFVFAVEVTAQAETLSGTVVDPQQHGIAGAEVSLACGKQIDARKTDNQGYFTFMRQAFPENCKIGAVYPSFAVLELTLGRSRSLTLQLRLAELKQTVAATTNRLSPVPLASVSPSADDLRNTSDNSETLIAFAQPLAGVDSGSDHISMWMECPRTICRQPTEYRPLPSTPIHFLRSSPTVAIPISTSPQIRLNESLA